MPQSIENPSLAVTSAGTAVSGTLPFDGSGGYPASIRITTTANAYIRLGNFSAPAAVAGDLLVVPGEVLELSSASFYTISVLSVSGSATVYVDAINSGSWARDLYPSLDLDFAGKHEVDPRITFTRASTATYFDASGVMKTASSNVPRIDHNPVTGECLGLLIEESRTNLVLNSASFSTQNVTVTAVAMTLSFWGTGTVMLSGTSSAGPLIGTGASNRVSLTFTPTAGTLTLTVSGTVSNAQLEVGAFPTSYIPTVASQVTRAADNASMTGTNFSGWYRQDEGTIFVENNYDYGSGVGGYRYALQIDDGSSSNVIIIYNHNGSSANRYYGSNSIVTPWSIPGASNTSAFVKTAGAYKVNDTAVSSNGGTAAVDTSATLPEPRVRLNIGIATSSAYLNGHIKRIAYYPRRLSNAQLQAITV